MKTKSSSLPSPQLASAKPLVFSPEQFKRFSNFAEAYYFNAAENPEAIAYDQAQRESTDEYGTRRYQAVSQRESKERVLRIAALLESLGVEHGDAVAVLSLDRPEWTEAEMAIHTVGAHIVPVYVRDTKERLAHILRDADVSFAFVENQQQLEKMLQLMPAPSGLSLRHLISFEDVVVPPSAKNVTTLRETLGDVDSVRDEQSFAWPRTERDDLACIFYTSGSSGQPKGVPVTHGQLLANLYQIAAAEMVEYDKLRAKGEQPMVTFLLPERAHAYPARSAQLVFTTPARARYPAVVDPTCSEIDDAFRESVRRDLREGGGGMIPIVPKIAVAIEQRVRQRLAAGGFRERLASLVVENTVAKMLRVTCGRRDVVGDGLHLLLSLLRKRVAQRIRCEIVGPQFEYFVSGGAKLPLETAAFLFAIGLPIYEGYGSTETNCPIASGTPRQHRLGSVGKLFAEIEVKVDRVTSELLVKGPNVVSGYLHGAEDSASSWDADGWYHTRDIASLDDDGFLQIEGRLDNVIVLLNGENVSPVAIESYCVTIPGVESVLVIGNHRPALVALFAMNEDAVLKWAADKGHRLAMPWRHDPELLAWLRDEVEQHVNRRAGHPYECIRNVAIIESPSVQQQTLTATEKLRREEIMRRYATLINQLYDDPKQWLAPLRQASMPTRRVAAL